MKNNFKPLADKSARVDGGLLETQKQLSGFSYARKARYRLMAGAALVSFFASVACAGEVEVLHFWTSPGEKKSVDVLKAKITERGHVWKDFSVAGGAGENAMSALARRLKEGNPPAAASIKAPVIKVYAAARQLADLDAMAEFDNWERSLPPTIRDLVRVNGHYVGVPINIHRNNWMWSNLAVLAASGVAAPPTTVPELFSALDKIKAAGYDGLAMGGQGWQELILFENLLLASAGQDVYLRALGNAEPSALNSAEFKTALRNLRALKKYTDAESNGRSWNDTTKRLIDKKAAFQFMGDWAKGEFTAANLVPNKDYACTPAPGTQDYFVHVVDSFAMFQLRNWEAQKAQGYLAYQIMRPEFQTEFSVNKGSIPAIRYFDEKRFDACAKASHADFLAAEKNKTLVGSVAVDMVVSPEVLAFLRETIHEFWSNDKTSVESTISKFISGMPKKVETSAVKTKK